MFELLGIDPDETLTLLVEAASATDTAMARQARALATRLLLETARRAAADRRGVHRLRTRRGGEGDLDLDAALDDLLVARAHGRAATLDELPHRSWYRGTTATCVLLDCSGSMSGRRLATAAMVTAVATLADPANTCVIAFAQRPVVLRAPGAGTEVERTLTEVLRRRGHGPTDLAAALIGAARLLERAPATHRRVLLVGDTRATTGADPRPTARDLEELAVIAPEADHEDVARFGAEVGARWATVSGPSAVPAAIHRVWTDR